MENKNIINLKELTDEAVKDIIKGGFIQEKITEYFKKCMEDAIKDTFNSWSDFSKELKKELSNKLKLDFSRITLPEYNQTLTNLFKEMSEALIIKEGRKSLEENMKRIITPIKDDWKFEDIVDEIKEHWNEDGEYFNEEMGMEIKYTKLSDGSVYGIHIDLKIKANENYSRDKIRIFLGVNKNEDGSNPMEDDSVPLNCYMSGLTIDDTDMAKVFVAGRQFGIEEKLFLMYSQKNKIIFQENLIDTYYGSKD